MNLSSKNYNNYSFALLKNKTFRKKLIKLKKQK